MTDPDDDGWQEYKDGVAMGYLNEDGSQREPDEPGWVWNCGRPHLVRRLIRRFTVRIRATSGEEAPF